MGQDLDPGCGWKYRRLCSTCPPPPLTNHLGFYANNQERWRHNLIFQENNPPDSINLATF